MTVLDDEIAINPGPLNPLGEGGHGEIYMVEE
jgi:hypothetical protein